jgi:hypothetical protein
MGLAMYLQSIQANDEKYVVRYTLVLAAVEYANRLGYSAGFRIDPTEPEWPCAFIELPGAGQVSWHIPQHVNAWDGHDTEVKYERVKQFIDSVGE